jgi:hypothetical protein
MTNDFYIFTEIVNCGKIGKIALDSFHKYHDHAVHVYGTKADFEWISPHKNNIFIEVDERVLKGYERGHIGTAHLWEEVIKKCGQKYMIHFDSDVIFRANMVDHMIEKSKEYDLIGPVRNYHHNPQHIQGVRHLADLCQTNCTLWNKNMISPRYLGRVQPASLPSIRKIASLSFIQIARRVKWGLKNLFMGKDRLSEFARMIHGTYNPLGFQTIDFFDPIMFDMIANGAKIFHLDFDEAGGCDEYGKRDNAFKDINNFPTPYKLDFGSKLVHFSCVGSGMNFYHNKEAAKSVGRAYVECALDRYALFCKTFYNEELAGIPLEKYEKIFSIKEWY